MFRKQHLENFSNKRWNCFKYMKGHVDTFLLISLTHAMLACSEGESEHWTSVEQAGNGCQLSPTINTNPKHRPNVAWNGWDGWQIIECYPSWHNLARDLPSFYCRESWEFVSTVKRYELFELLSTRKVMCFWCYNRVLKGWFTIATENKSYREKVSNRMRSFLFLFNWHNLVSVNLEAKVSEFIIILAELYAARVYKFASWKAITDKQRWT